MAVGRACLLPPLSSGGALVARPWLRFHIHRVTGGGRPPPVPTERGVRISRTNALRQLASQHCKRLQLPVWEAQFRCQQRCPFFDLVEGVPGEAAAGPATAAQHPAPVTLHDPIYFDENSEDFRRRRNKHSGRVGRR